MTTTALVVKTDRDRFVALAFCWADLLFELDPRLRIVFVAGPTDIFFGREPGQLIGRSIKDLVACADAPLFGHILRNAQLSGRIDNEGVRLKKIKGAGNFAMSVSGYCLDGPGSNFFLGMRRVTPLIDNPFRKTTSGLPDAQTFSRLASERVKRLQASGNQAEITLIVLSELEKLYEQLDEPSRAQLRQRVVAALKACSLGGDSAAEVEDGRYSVLHAVDADLDGLVKHIQGITQSADPSGKGVAVALTTMEVGTGIEHVREEDLAKGLLYAMNRFRDSRGKDFTMSLLSANIASLCETAVKEVKQFRNLLGSLQFDVALQPIVDLTDGEIHHYEALCRFQGVASGESPYRYISFAEETEMIQDFDLAMAKKVMAWLASPAVSSVRPTVAVNVSGYSVGNSAYMTALDRLLRDNPWTRGRVIFEITESARLRNLQAANGFIQSLRQLGYFVALDDFGAGAASFQYLSSLEVDVVKLDGSAVRNAESGKKGKAFLSALTELCRRLNVKTIAEMIDTAERLKFCRDCGCDYVQGYLFGKPSTDFRTFTPIPHAHLFPARSWRPIGSRF